MRLHPTQAAVRWEEVTMIIILLIVIAVLLLTGGFGYRRRSRSGL
jgi:LPXTG-motif cell wall-anchored protein